jgi:hypothetical protein
MIDFNTFLANVNENDLAMMTVFVQGQRVFAGSAAEADALFLQAQRLFTAGMLWRVVRGYEMKDGATAQSFDGFVTPEGAAYLARLARERVTLSRQPLP